MPLVKTLAQLRSLIKAAAGMNTSGTSVDLTPDVLNGIANDAVYEGWDVITQRWADYYTVSTPLTLVAGTSTYAVPSTFYKFRQLENSDQRKLLPIALEDRHRFQGQTGEPTHYMLMSRTIHVFRSPSTAQTLTLWHIPIKSELQSDGDTVTFDVPIELKYVIAIAWRDVLDRQGLDPSPAIAKMQAYEAKLRTAADSLDAGEPFYLGDFSRVTDDDWSEVPD